MKAVTPGTVNPIHEIPALNEEGVERIDLSKMEGWDELSVEKQRYLVAFSKGKLKQKRAALKVGISARSVTEWKRDDPNFLRFFEDIIELHVEGVEEVDYIASFSASNNTSRGRFLNNRSKNYKEPAEKLPVPRIGTQNNQTNIMAVLNSDDINKKGLAGVQKMFNQLKENPTSGDQSPD